MSFVARTEIKPLHAATGKTIVYATHDQIEAMTLATMIEGFVDVVEPAGSGTFVVTQLGGKALTARMRSDVPVKTGTPMPFAFNLDKAVMFDPQSGMRL